jgi:hypothetical protein
MSTIRNIRVFIASSSDVSPEHEAAVRIVQELAASTLFLGRVAITPVSWRQTYLQGGVSPQKAIAEGLPRPSQCDIAVFIFWSRLGTPILDQDPQFTKPDGTPYTGTEWEYNDALTGFRTRGTPTLLLYRKDQAVQMSTSDPDFFERAQQMTLLNSFLQSVQQPKDGKSSGGTNAFSSTADFEGKLRDHLLGLINALLTTPPKPADTAPGETGPVAALIRTYLDEGGWKYQYSNDRFVLQCDGNNGSYFCVIQPRERQQQIVFYSYFPMKLAEDKRTAGAEYAARANYGMIIGNLEIDVNDGEVRFKTSLDIEDLLVPPKVVGRYFGYNLTTMDRYALGLFRVIWNDMPVREAIALVESQARPGPPQQTE